MSASKWGSPGAGRAATEGEVRRVAALHSGGRGLRREKGPAQAEPLCRDFSRLY
jgi:hypothetical protein